MTMRLVQCEFCQHLADFQIMHMCPLCRRVVCRRCKHEGPLRAGQCARPVPCAEAAKHTPPPPKGPAPDER